MAQPGFQTTFIPKRDDMQKKRASGGGIFLAISIVILVCTGVVALGFFSYAKVIEGSIAEKKESLERSQDKFEPGLIELLADLDMRLEEATTLLDDHIAPSKLFRLVEEATLRSVQFTSFGYFYDPQTNRVSISLTGEGTGYAAAALQSDEFQNSDVFENPIFSGLQLDEGTGRVSFSIDTEIDAALIDYTEALVADTADTTGEEGSVVEEVLEDEEVVEDDPAASDITDEPVDPNLDPSTDTN